MGIEVILSSAEMRLGEIYGQARYDTNRKRGYSDQRVGNQDNAHTDILGMRGELGFCNLANCYPDLTLGDEEYDQIDCTLANGLTVDVKTAPRLTDNLLVRPCKASKKVPHLYALMLGEGPAFLLAGLYWSDELFRESNLRDMGHGPTYFIGKERLWLDHHFVPAIGRKNESA